MGLLPMCAGLGSPSWNSRNRAPGRSPARGALRGARESRIQLTDGLIRTKETPTSPPAPSYAIIPARSFHPLRVGNAGGELTIKATSDAVFRELIDRFVSFYNDSLFNPR